MTCPRQYTVSSVFGVDNPDYHNGVGIEIEYENYSRKGNQWASVLWDTSPDGSLRGSGVEFISVPLSPYDIPAAFESLRGGFEHGFDCRPSFRCGVHVHLNMTEYNMNEFMAVCAFYALLEPALMDYCGEERQDNIFCVPWYHTPSQSVDVFQRAKTMMQAGADANVVAHGIQSHTNKYQAVNLRPLWELGTIEFRMAPTWPTTEKIEDWVTAMTMIRSVGAGLGSPEAVMELYRADRLTGLLEMIGLPTPGERLPYTDEAEDVAEALCYEALNKDDVEWTYPDNFTRVNPEPDVNTLLRTQERQARAEAAVRHAENIAAEEAVSLYGSTVLERMQSVRDQIDAQPVPTEPQRRFTAQAVDALHQADLRRLEERVNAEHQANEQRAMEDADAPPPVPAPSPFEMWDDVLNNPTEPRVFRWNPPNREDT